jgi:hypothetical protein
VLKALTLKQWFKSNELEAHLIPAGQLSLVGVEEQSLFVLDSQSGLHRISLNSTILSFYFNLASGNTLEALKS